jgi:Flp pilus assembly protein TadG
MFRSVISRFAKEDRAAIGPLFAIGISTFVVMSAIGFDYGRLMALDTELQNAADQAALAAATQLDGGEDAMVRARTAATDAFASAGSTFTNETRLANDGQGRPITSLTFEFFDDYSNDTPGNLLTNDADGAEAKIVQVTVNARRVFYALTPLVGAFNSGDVIGKAMAGLQSATCNVPPMMFCVPEDASGNVQTDFPTEADIGRGLKLHFKTQGNANGTGNNTTDTAVWAPGNFGFLDLDYGISGNDKVRTLGLNSQFRGCTGEVIESEPGFRDPQADALNSRFDVFTGSVNANACNNAGDFCPAENVRRDWVNVQTRNNVRQSDIAGLTCNSSPANNGWTRVSALPTSAVSPNLIQAPGSLEFPYDNCLASGSCGDFVGDGEWDGAAYMAKHHPGVSLSTAAPNGTRYEVYQWEIANKGTRLISPRRVGHFATYRNGTGANARYNVDLYCSYPQPVNARALAASDTQKDRRVLTVAAVDCTGLNGKAPVKILRWVDMFLVKPANVTASDKNFFSEIIGPAQQANGDSGFQYFGRKKAVLIR